MPAVALGLALLAVTAGCGRARSEAAPGGCCPARRLRRRRGSALRERSARAGGNP